MYNDYIPGAKADTDASTNTNDKTVNAFIS